MAVVLLPRFSTIEPLLIIGVASAFADAKPAKVIMSAPGTDA